MKKSSAVVGMIEVVVVNEYAGDDPNKQLSTTIVIKVKAKR
ncbi:MAG: hypothetical protein ACR9NN_08500 [Nostochopsis sp.]